MEDAKFKWDGRLLLDGLSRVRFRLKASARHRLALDIAVLCTGLRAVVMVDYASEVSQLQHQLCKLLNLLAQEIRFISFLKVMCIDDIVYLIHVNNLSLLMDGTLNHSVKLEFVVLDDDVVRFASPIEKEEALNHFASFKNCFLVQLSKVCTSFSSTAPIDIGSSETSCEAALPTLNGWLLGYPVVYLFKKENVSKAVQTLSVSALQQFKILVQSSLPFQTSEVQGQKGRVVMHELTSFTLPSELSTEGVCEEQVSSFMHLMQIKVKDSQLWKSLELQVISRICQSVVL